MSKLIVVTNVWGLQNRNIFSPLLHNSIFLHDWQQASITQAQDTHFLNSPKHCVALSGSQTVAFMSKLSTGDVPYVFYPHDCVSLGKKCSFSINSYQWAAWNKVDRVQIYADKRDLHVF